ncbi:Multidrug resistance-associated protein 4 [Stylophora pistillata]|uniref:Multidrug resistance-associated protein 4 n=1 Tax=Stylophora pistillata TaxID=50429 RepID=A0A2B4RI51_STYPI|nr:Multidrug resistance-associated protein 4 [Stylophora pistillata]
MNTETSTRKNQSPLERAHIFSLLFFWWMNDTLKLGYQRPLQDEDLLPLQEELKTETLVDKLEAEWLKESAICTRRNKQPCLWRVAFKMFSLKKYLKLVAVKLTHSLSNILLPIMVWLFLSSLSENADVNQSSTILQVVAISFLTVVKGMSHHHSFFLAGIFALQLKVSAIGLIYKKILKLNRRSFNEIASGQTINLVSNDANRLQDAVWSMLFFVFAPIEILSSGVLLWFLIGWQALVGAGFFLIVIIYISVLSKKAGHLREDAASVTDRRLEILNEVMAGIRSIKIHAWEWNFRDLIRNLRTNEIGIIRWRGAILSSFDALYFTNTPIAGFISMTTLLLTNNHLTAFQIFTLMSTLNVIKFSVSVSMGETLHLLADAKVSFDRIQKFLELSSFPGLRENDIQLKSDGSPTFDQKHFQGENFTFNEFTSFCTIPKKENIERACLERSRTESWISLKNISCSWNQKDKPDTLRSVSINIYNNQFITITGPVGCGKSSLLQAILGELPCNSGEIRHSGSIAYVPQLPCVFSGTIQHNITFGKPLDELRYQGILEACSLHKDLEQFSKGDLTHIGQRGVSLSGGQSARICLARALYADRDIYLLDDPLSAVDIQVGKHIFRKCLRGLLSEKICVLVTHQHQFLESNDYTVVMERGSIECQGKYVDLLNNNMLSKTAFVGKGYQRKESLKMSIPIRRRRTETSLGLPTMEEVGDGLDEGGEDRMMGKVSWTLYWQYFRSALPAALLMCLFVLVLFVQVVSISPYWWLSRIASMSDDQQRDLTTLGIYGSLVIGTLILSTIISFLFLSTLLRASEKLHDKMFTAIIKAPVFFFDTNPVGRILNRFSKDVGCMDDTLPPQFLLAVQLCLFSLGATLLPAATNYWLVIGITPLILLFFYYARYYLKTSRELKRLEAIKCSPVYSHISDTIAGLEVIRSSDMEKIFLQDLFRYQDQNTPAVIMVLGSSKWLGVRLELLCSLLVALVAAGAVLVTQIPGSHRALRDITVDIKDKEKVGLVGRTGSGKSSVVAALFRMPQPDGMVMVDGIDLETLNIQDVRRTFSVITQYPFLYAGSVRDNMDPFKKFEDHEIWNALEDVQMKQWVQLLPGQLQYRLTESGSNLSVGERQLLCLARVLLQKNKIVILDEVTANVDFKTDRLIQEVIRTKLKDVTVLTIAHRLESIIDYDRVMVIDRGRVVEFDKPGVLLNKRGSYFAELVKSYNGTVSS